jgi:hypothetical protein
MTVLKAKRSTRATDIIVTAMIMTAHAREYLCLTVAAGPTATARLRELLPRPFVCKCETMG